MAISGGSCFRARFLVPGWFALPSLRYLAFGPVYRWRSRVLPSPNQAVLEKAAKRSTTMRCMIFRMSFVFVATYTSCYIIPWKLRPFPGGEILPRHSIKTLHLPHDIQTGLDIGFVSTSTLAINETEPSRHHLNLVWGPILMRRQA